MQTKKLKRIDGIDTLRGFLLFIMILDHLPGFWVYYTYQPFGFISGAEFFIFLSAFLVGKIYIKYSNFSDFINWIKNRILKLYFTHLAIFLFILLISFAFLDQYGSYEKYTLIFNFDFISIVSILLMLYQPPFLDILPTYIFLLIITPIYLLIAKKFGWKFMLGFSVFIWLLSQFGIRDFLGKLLSDFFIVDFGHFDDFAWQLIWSAGLYMSTQGFYFNKNKIFVFMIFLLAIILFIVKALYIPIYINFINYSFIIEKTNFGFLRAINLYLFVFIFIYFKEYFLTLSKYLHIYSYFGKNSLTILSIHLLFNILALGLIERFYFSELYMLLLLLFELFILVVIVIAIETKSKNLLTNKKY